MKMWLKSVLNRIKYNVIFISFPALLLGILGPLEIYKGNYNEFQFGLNSFLRVFVIYTIIAIIIGSIILSCVPLKAEKIFQNMIFAFAFLIYIQNMFMNKVLMNEDGSKINWKETALRHYTIINSIIWLVVGLAIILLPRIIKKNLNRIYYKISFFLLAIQLATCISLIITTPHKDLSNDSIKILSGKDQCSVAPNNNVILIILDRYSNDEFDELLNNNPETKDIFKDFTYFNNADSHYNYTFPSLAHIVTGEDVDLSISPEEWVNGTWNQKRCKDFYSILHELGYTCNIYTDENVWFNLGNVTAMEGCIDNTIPDKPTADEAWLCRLMLKMSIYKYSPYVIKPKFESNWDSFSKVIHYESADGSVAFYNGDFYKRIQNEGVHINSEYNNMYAIIHLAGMHDPYNTDEYGNLVEEKESSSEITQKGLNAIVSEYLSQLKELGVYDKATIIITADHGTWIDYNNPQPIFLVKTSGNINDEMCINDSPISHDDILATVLVSAGYNNYHEEFGKSIFDWEGDYNRVRELCYPADGYNVYQYVGDREAIKKKIESNDYTNSPSEKGWY